MSYSRQQACQLADNSGRFGITGTMMYWCSVQKPNIVEILTDLESNRKLASLSGSPLWCLFRPWRISNFQSLMQLLLQSLLYLQKEGEAMSLVTMFEPRWNSWALSLGHNLSLWVRTTDDKSPWVRSCACHSGPFSRFSRVAASPSIHKCLWIGIVQKWILFLPGSNSSENLPNDA